MSALRFAVPYVALAALVSACGSHEPRQTAPSTTAPLPRRCALRFVSGRILVDGEPVARATAVERCKQYGEAIVYIDDESLQTEWSAIEADFQRSSVRVYMSGPTGGTVNFGQPPRIRVQRPVPERTSKEVKVVAKPSSAP